MAFQFSLAALLRYRQSIEQQQELRLQQANQQVSGLRREIEEARQEAAEVTAHDAKELATGLRAAQLHFSLVQRGMLAEHCAKLERELEAARQLQSQQRLALQKARQQRELVDNLRERQLREFELQESRREQRHLDDMYVIRREFVRRDWRNSD